MITGGTSLFSIRPNVGLDIGERKIKLVQVMQNGSNFQITAHGSILTPPGTIENGFIVNPEDLGQELSRLVQELGLKGK